MASNANVQQTLSQAQAEMNALLERWEQDSNQVTPNPIPILTEIAEKLEKETEAYLKMDPDPFDDRHPSRTRRDCILGAILKTIFKNEEFISQLTMGYLMHRDNKEIQTIACRLLLDLLPGLETSMIFKDNEHADDLIARLFEWAEDSEEPLQSYATGLLAAAMDLQEVAVNFKDKNVHLVPIMLKRLKALQDEYMKDLLDKGHHFVSPAEVHFETLMGSPQAKRRLMMSPCHSPPFLNDCSNSSWAELEPLMIGSHQVWPLTIEFKQRVILQYLTPMGDYQELISFVFEQNALNIVLHYINLKENQDIRLAFDALKYLSSLICHKKFAIEFLNSGGLQQLLQVYRPSVAATGVSLCLYYLAYNEDAMERICSMSKNVLQNLVLYNLWLLECSHDSSRCHATMFFSLSFSFKVILNLFDHYDGLRKLLNVIFVLNVFSDDEDASEDDLFTRRQTARHVCVALKKYFEAHLIHETESLRRNSSSYQRNGVITDIPPNKPAKINTETILEYVETLLEMMPLKFHWRPVEDLMNLGGVKLLLSLIYVSYDWNYQGKSEAVKSALDVLIVCSVLPKFQPVLCEEIVIEPNQKCVGMKIILTAAELEMDPEVQKSALQVIINCVCGPLNRIGGSVPRAPTGSVKKKFSFRSGEDLLNKMWTCVRVNNGIMILLKLLMTKTPITDADCIRALSCKALCGLARSSTVKQIIGKLPLFTTAQLQSLMKEPILQDKRTEHVKFCKYCVELIESVTGSPLTTKIEASIADINKAEVVAQTNISYKERELLQLIAEHLKAKGFHESASTLQKEANLPVPGPKSTGFNWPILHTSSSPLPTRIPRQIPTTPSSSQVATPNTPYSSQEASSASSPIIPPFSSPLQIKLHKRRVRENTPRSQTLQKCPSSYQSSPAYRRTCSQASAQNSSITLDSIVTEYLRKQHALCKNPVVTCPPFDLFVPHRCPEPTHQSEAPANIAVRMSRREINPRFGGNGGARLNRKFIYSKFRPTRSYREIESGNNYTSCAFSFSPKGQYLLIGSINGELYAYNNLSGEMEWMHGCHNSEMTNIIPSKDGRLLLTSSIWSGPQSVLWTFDESMAVKMDFPEDGYVEFGNKHQEWVLGTKETAARLYDIQTQKLVSTFSDENLSNNYKKNRATFHPSDDLILNDGVLWDVRSTSFIHKFDKFNSSINGVFHPNGQEIISNSEIWDIRTFHLLKTVPALSGCRVRFNTTGEVIYGAMFEEDEQGEDDEEDNHEMKRIYASSFRTFDATDYSSIATIDIKKSILDLAVCPDDNYIAIVENQSLNNPFSSESVCRIYSVGRGREEDDEEPEDDEEEEEGDDLDDEDDSGSDDDNINTDDIRDEVIEIGSDSDDDDDDMDSEAASDESEEIVSFSEDGDGSDSDEAFMLA